MKSERRRQLLGGLALSFFLIHATFHAINGRPHDILWSCTLSNALIALGLFGTQPLWVAVGVTWLCMGNLTWLADVLSGGEFFVTSTLTHFGGLTVGILGARELGWPRRSFLWATAFMLGLQQLSRLATPPSANVNLAFAVQTGWERYYPNYLWFWLAMFAQAAGVYYIVGRLFERWLKAKQTAQGDD